MFKYTRELYCRFYDFLRTFDFIKQYRLNVEYIDKCLKSFYFNISEYFCRLLEQYKDNSRYINKHINPNGLEQFIFYFYIAVALYAAYCNFCDSKKMSASASIMLKLVLPFWSIGMFTFGSRSFGILMSPNFRKNFTAQ
jgi:hypothetical protein